MFDYKQRPWARKITDAEYSAAVGKTPPEITAHIDPADIPSFLKAWESAGNNHKPSILCPICGASGDHYHSFAVPHTFERLIK